MTCTGLIVFIFLAGVIVGSLFTYMLIRELIHTKRMRVDWEEQQGGEE